ncbi:hypothetical protein EGI32_02830 [Ferruginibacter sp. HRS2-29]|nr:hypothetical protein [Ferruginibacter sp. HRS2-29]
MWSRQEKTQDSTGNARFKKCRFNAYFKKPATWGKLALLAGYTVFEDCTFKSSGYADFKGVLNEEWLKIYQKRNTFIN